MKKKILLFTEEPPADRSAIHIWLGKSELPHEKCLSQLIERYLGFSPLRIETTPTGKPYLPNSPLSFNLSDTEDWLAVAFSWEAPIGIDIEVIRPIEEMEGLMVDCFSPREQAYVKSQNSVERFWEIWTRKEAYCKALGLGLQDQMNRLDCYGKGWILVNNVWVRSFFMKENFSAAVAICQ